MAIDINYQPESSQLVLSGELTIYHVDEIRGAIVEHPDALLNLSGIATIDGAGLQILLAHCRDKHVQLGSVSDAIRNVLDLVGKSELVGVAA